MKEGLSSVDLHFISEELSERIVDARIDKAYQLGEKEVKLSLYSSGSGASELVIGPERVCLTGYSSRNPEKPTSFAMQLRKRLSGGFIRRVEQHIFDRILEIWIEKKGESFVLIAEFFSTGNIVLCDDELRILGLLERQKWKDRTLKAGDTYTYPPKTADPLQADAADLREKMRGSQKKIASFLATDAGLGGTLAEEACALSGIEKDRKAQSLTEKEADEVFAAHGKLIERIFSHRPQAQIIMKGGEPIDVVPMDLLVYDGFEKKPFASFNDAVDEYFSKKGATETRKKADDVLGKEIGRLEEILRKQREVISRLEKESVESREKGDLLYQNMEGLSALLSSISEERRKGRSWKDIGEEVRGKEAFGIAIESLSEDGSLVLRIRR